MIFSSDNWAGAHPAIAESLVTHAAGYASAYGTSELDRTVEKKFSEIFERTLRYFSSAPELPRTLLRFRAPIGRAASLFATARRM